MCGYEHFSVTVNCLYIVKAEMSNLLTLFAPPKVSQSPDIDSLKLKYVELQCGTMLPAFLPAIAAILVFVLRYHW